MKIGDIIKTVLIILIFVILYFSSFITVGLHKLKEDWPKYRCTPTMMPFAGYLGHDTAENFNYCVGNTQKDMMGFFLGPVNYVLGMVGNLAEDLIGNIQNIRKMLSFLRKSVSGVVGDVYSMFINVLIQFQTIITKTKDTIMKIIGTMFTFVYLIQSGIKTGQSVNRGPIGKTLRSLCFSPNTPLTLNNKQTKKMRDIHLGDILENGSEVIGKLKLKGDKLNPYYKIWSNNLNQYIYVTGEHKIFDKNTIKKYIHRGNKKMFLDNYIKVQDYDKAIKTDKYDNELACLITSDHQIPVGEFVFWDWED